MLSGSLVAIVTPMHLDGSHRLGRLGASAGAPHQRRDQRGRGRGHDRRVGDFERCRTAGAGGARPHEAGRASRPDRRRRQQQHCRHGRAYAAAVGSGSRCVAGGDTGLQQANPGGSVPALRSRGGGVGRADRAVQRAVAYRRGHAACHGSAARETAARRCGQRGRRLDGAGARAGGADTGGFCGAVRRRCHGSRRDGERRTRGDLGDGKRDARGDGAADAPQRCAASARQRSGSMRRCGRCTRHCSSRPTRFHSNGPCASAVSSKAACGCR